MNAIRLALRSVPLTSPAMAALVLCLAGVRSAHAAIPGDRAEFSGYGRIGMAWSLDGQNLQGKYMNLTDFGIGGRFEEGDYVEPTMKLHLVKDDKDNPSDFYVDTALSIAMFAKNGSFLEILANNTSETLGMELLQAYIEANNVFVPGLTLWGGAKQYRGTDVHIADYFYFNDLTGQGGGLLYKGIDLAVLVQTAGDTSYPGFNFDADGDDEPEVNRMRTMLVAQYHYDIGTTGHQLHGLAELHILPAVSVGRREPDLAGADYGGAFGAKLHLDLGRGQFNDLSFRLGTGIANGAFGGRKTWQTFGPPDEEGKYSGAYGVEAVEHFLVNFGDLLTLNGYGILHYNKAAQEGTDGIILDETGAEVSPSRALDFAVGVRSILYAHRQFHMVNEVTFQGRKDGDRDMGTAVKLSVVPTIVPTGESSAWARPHLRAIYTAGFYNSAAVEQELSPYLRATGATSRIAHYFGARSEWWY